MRERVAAAFAFLLLCAILPARADVIAPAADGSETPIGRLADHLLDRSGRLAIADVARDASLFSPSTGRMPNYGVADEAGAKLWLRMQFATLPGRRDSPWVITLAEPRIHRATLYTPEGDGFRALVRDIGDHPLSGAPPQRLRSFSVPADDLNGKTVYLAIETRGSLRANVSIAVAEARLEAYAAESAGFALLFGVVGVTAFYLILLSAALREASVVALASLFAAFLMYIVADRGFLDLLEYPGSTTVSRIASWASTFVALGALVLFTAIYLETSRRSPWLAAAALTFACIVALLSLVAAAEVLFAFRILRPISAWIGLAALAICMALAAEAVWRATRRGLAFLLAWSPAFVTLTFRQLADAAPSLNAHPLVINALYIGCSATLVAFAFATAVDLRRRDRAATNALAASEDRFRRYASASSDLFWETDAVGLLTSANGPLRNSLGRPLVEALSRYGASDDHATDLPALQSALAQRAPFRSLRLAFGRKVLSVSGLPFSRDDAFGGFQGTATDVTEEVKRDRLWALNERLAQVGRATSEVAHSLTNLLHPIINLSRLIRDDRKTPDPQRDNAERVMNAGRKAAEIADAVLQAGRLSAPGGLQPFGVAVRSVVEVLQPLAPASLAIACDLRRDDGPLVGALDVYQVVSNLVANATEATGRTGRIDIAFDATPDGWRLTIADDGPGMTPDVLRQAQDAFFSTRMATGGTGLGLWIVRSTVEKWRGRMTIESSPGRGVAVTIDLPTNSGKAPP